MAIIDLNNETMGSDATTDVFVQTQEVLMRIAQNTQLVQAIQAVCDHPNQIIALQKQITDLQMKQLLPPACDHMAFEQQIQQLMNNLDEPRRTPRTMDTDEDLRQELDEMTRDARGASAEAVSLRTQLANALALAAHVAPTPPQQQEDRVQKFLDSPDFSGSDQTQLRGWIAQLQMIIRHKTSSFPEAQSKYGTHSSG
jgi:hypothetical protein